MENLRPPSQPQGGAQRLRHALSQTGHLSGSSVAQSAHQTLCEHGRKTQFAYCA